ncbi:outer membrane porin [Maritalea myrionectae]|uniref:Outer membrane porin n=1 Tax=Maritalea myrionectae TaxID=454601 RepID=A0A2R4MAQ1_9HYPH|nr:OmpA family protein [Maritalea myrionectae]AVX03080.1 outer membrane porin [Maritalea myrionectae]
MRNALITNTMLAVLSLAPLQAIAQEEASQEAPQEQTAPQDASQATPADVVVAYEQYAEAILSFRQAEVEAETVLEARESLLDICVSLEMPDLSACLDQYIAPEMRVANDIEPLEPEAAESSSVLEVETEAAVEAAAEPLEGEGVLDTPAAEVQQEPASEETATQETATEETASQETSNQEAPVELIAAYEEYVSARFAFDQVQAEGGDVEAAADTAMMAREYLVEVCASLGVPELEACLDQYIAPDMRIANDLAPLKFEATQESEAVLEAPEAEATTEGQVEAEASTSEMDAGSIDQPVDEATELLESAQNVEAETGPEDVAPVLDSAKEETSTPVEGEAEVAADTEASASSETEVKEDVKAEDTADTTPPENDAEAQEATTQMDVTSITAEEGERLAATDESAVTRGAPEDAEVMEQSTTDFRVVFQFNNQVIVENQDNSRLEQEADETYIERLSNGRIRETILRANGTAIVTIYNRNGDIIRRSRFTADGEEQVLVYVDEAYEQDLLEWRDPALDLGPLRLDIPVSEYVLDADNANEDELVQFLDQPPVERVQRLYSVNEVKRSARVRDMVRRLEIGGLTFETNKATIPTDQVASLTNVANAMLDMLEENPAETFLIEGHTDAVGGEIYNLALSDRRAETVAVILSRAFGVPPENLATQGYGERYLKIRTQQADRRNRRVTIKRITPLISPVARR